MNFGKPVYAISSLSFPIRRLADKPGDYCLMLNNENVYVYTHMFCRAKWVTLNGPRSCMGSGFEVDQWCLVKQHSPKFTDKVLGTNIRNGH